MKPLSLSMPHIIAMVGVPGAGKTYFAQQFSKTFSAPFLCCHYIQPLSNNDEDIHVATLDLLQEIAKTKKTIVYEGQTDSSIDRKELTQIANQSGYNVLFVWVQTDLVTARNRSKDNLPKNVFKERVSALDPPQEKEAHIVISGRHTYSTQARTVLKRISEDSQQKPAATTVPPQSVPMPENSKLTSGPSPVTEQPTTLITRSTVLSRPPIGRIRS